MREISMKKRTWIKEVWLEGTGSYDKPFLRQSPALVAENQISIFLELGERKVIVALVSYTSSEK